VHVPRSRVAALVGYYDAAFMRFGLDVSRPGNAWVVNGRGQAVGRRVGRRRLETLPRATLRNAAVRGASDRTGARSVGGSIDTQEVVGYAPVSGLGPAGGLGWSVVAARDVGSFSLPQTDARRQALMAGVAVGVLVLLIFGWLYLMVIGPLLRMQREAERLAHGDLSHSVEVVRYDEIGLIGRALERLRVRLIGTAALASSSRERGNGRPGRSVKT
jgi:methyl-accepting chemotaxis protein